MNKHEKQLVHLIEKDLFTGGNKKYSNITMVNSAGIKHQREMMLRTNYESMIELIPVIASHHHLRPGLKSEDIMKLIKFIIQDEGTTITKYKYVRDMGKHLMAHLHISRQLREKLEDTYYLPAEESFKFVNRYQAEYEPGMIQISSVINIVHEEFGSVVLTKEDKVHTLVQGHTNVMLDRAYARSDDTITFRDLVISNIRQEMEEEAMCTTDTFTEDMKLDIIGLVRSNQDLHSQGHIGVVFNLKLQDKPMLFTTEETHEPHWVQDISNLENRDQWMQIVSELLRHIGVHPNYYSVFRGDNYEVLEYLRIYE